MRKTRPEDFDPNYKKIDGKLQPEVVNMDGVVPIKPKSNRETNLQNNEHYSERSHLRTQNRSEIRTANLPLKRRTKRYSFEFYADQIVKLKQLKIAAEMIGESLSLSEMVREALDEYLQDKQID